MTFTEYLARTLSLEEEPIFRSSSRSSHNNRHFAANSEDSPPGTRNPCFPSSRISGKPPHKVQRPECRGHRLENAQWQPSWSEVLMYRSNPRKSRHIFDKSREPEGFLQSVFPDQPEEFLFFRPVSRQSEIYVVSLPQTSLAISTMSR